MLRRHGIQAITRVMAYVISDAVTLSSTMRTGGFELASSALTSSTLKWLQRILFPPKKMFQQNLFSSKMAHPPYIDKRLWKTLLKVTYLPFHRVHQTNAYLFDTMSHKKAAEM
jgi:hypothetical protein